MAHCQPWLLDNLLSCLSGDLLAGQALRSHHMSTCSREPQYSLQMCGGKGRTASHRQFWLLSGLLSSLFQGTSCLSELYHSSNCSEDQGAQRT